MVCYGQRGRRNFVEWEQVGKLEMERLYYDENLSDSLIAERFGVSKSEVKKKRKLYNISIRMHSIDTAFTEYQRLLDQQFQNENPDLLSLEDVHVLLNQEAKRRLVQSENIDALAKALTHYIFRHGPVENMHANGQLSQEDMKTLNEYMVNHLSWILTCVFEGDWMRLELLFNNLSHYGKQWDPADPHQIENL